MWAEASQSTALRAYFNVFPTYEGTGANPNVAALETRFAVAPLVRWEAVLGVWRDCNGDGAIGMAALALDPYPAELLLDTSACLPATAHHDGRQVRELLTIGPHPNAPIHDGEARVWGDYGAPGAGGSEGCTVTPLPRGTFSHTGRLLRAADCASEHRLIGAINTADNDGSLGLAVEDVHHPEESSSALSQPLPVSPFGDPATGRSGPLDPQGPPTLLIADCDGVEPAIAGDPVAASLWASAAHASDAFAGDCEPTTGTPLDPFYVSVEGDVEPTSHAGRDRNDVVFQFSAAPGVQLALEPWRSAAAEKRTAASELRWRALSATITRPDTLERGSLEPPRAAMWTFFAEVGTQTTDLGIATPSGTGVYGAEACGGYEDGIVGGWECDPARWWDGADGDTMPRGPGGMPLGARVGEAYRFRDVDCADGGIGTVGLHAGTGAISAHPCWPSP